MKRIVLSLCVLFVSTYLHAQKEDVPAFEKAYTVKLSPAGLFLGKLGLGAEYNFKKKKSITFNIGIPIEKTLTTEIDDEDRELKIKTFSVMAGYRMYLGKNNIKGFYFEPFLKYVDNQFVTNTDFDIDGSNRAFLVTSEYSGFGIGAQLGVQFLIAKKVVIDFYFLGPEANIARHDLLAQETGPGLPWSPGEAQDAEEQIDDFVDDIPFLKDNLEVTVNAIGRNVKTRYNGFLPGIRFGLSIGLKF